MSVLETLVSLRVLYIKRFLIIFMIFFIFFYFLLVLKNFITFHTNN